jgi:hypothetical protein
MVFAFAGDSTTTRYFGTYLAPNQAFAVETTTTPHSGERASAVTLDCRKTGV